MKRRDATLPQTHLAVEKMFVDYAGPTMLVIDPETGRAREARVFVAVLGASNYTMRSRTAVGDPNLNG